MILTKLQKIGIGVAAVLLVTSTVLISYKSVKTKQEKTKPLTIALPDNVEKSDIEKIAQLSSKDQATFDKESPALQDKIAAIDKKINETIPSIDEIYPSGTAQTQEAKESLFKLVPVIAIEDKNGKPILPDYEKSNQTGFFPKAKATGTVGNGSITGYVYLTNEFSTDEINKLNDLFVWAIPQIEAVYGKPAFANQGIFFRKLSKDSPVGGTYVPSISSFYLHPDLFSSDNKNLLAIVFFHELIHAFHDDVALSNHAWEEGLTQAAANYVFRQYAPDSSLGYFRWMYYDQWNVPDLASPGANLGYGNVNGQLHISPFTSIREEMIGFTVAKMQAVNSTFLMDFNQNYYDKINKDGFDKTNQIDTCKSIAASLVGKSIEGQSFNDWYNNQYVFRDSKSMEGTKGYWEGKKNSIQRGFILLAWNYLPGNLDKGLKFNVSNYKRIKGIEYPEDYKFNFNGSNWDNSDKIGLGIDSTANVTGFTFPDFNRSKSTKGRWQFTLENTITGGAKQTQYFGIDTVAPVYTPGLWGTIVNQNSGNVTITRLRTLDANAPETATVKVENGMFTASEFANYSGEFEINFINDEGWQAKKTIIKDKSSYMVALSATNPTQQSLSYKFISQSNYNGQIPKISQNGSTYLTIKIKNTGSRGWCLNNKELCKNRLPVFLKTKTGNEYFYPGKDDWGWQENGTAIYPKEETIDSGQEATFTFAVGVGTPAAKKYQLPFQVRAASETIAPDVYANLEVFEK